MYHIASQGIKHFAHFVQNPAIFVSEPMSENRAAILVRLSPALKSRLLEIANREHRSLSKQVEFLLERCLRSEDFVDVATEGKSLSAHPNDRIPTVSRKRSQ